MLIDVMLAGEHHVAVLIRTWYVLFRDVLVFPRWLRWRLRKAVWAHVCKGVHAARAMEVGVWVVRLIQYLVRMDLGLFGLDFLLSRCSSSFGSANGLKEKMCCVVLRKSEKDPS